VRDIQTLAQGAPPAEARALRNLLYGYDAGLVLPLGDLAGLAASWNPASGQPRALVSQLTRRMLFLKNNQDQRSEVAQLQSCDRTHP
jgi:hypothetical protein